MKKENCICPAKAYITDKRSNLYEGTRAMKDEESHLIPVYIFDMYPYPDAEQGLSMPQKFLVLLKGTENSVVPITIGHFEGQALAMALRKIALPAAPAARSVVQPAQANRRRGPQASGSTRSKKTFFTRIC